MCHHYSLYPCSFEQWRTMTWIVARSCVRKRDLRENNLKRQPTAFRAFHASHLQHGLLDLLMRSADEMATLRILTRATHRVWLNINSVGSRKPFVLNSSPNANPSRLVRAANRKLFRVSQKLTLWKKHKPLNEHNAKYRRITNVTLTPRHLPFRCKKLGYQQLLNELMAMNRHMISVSRNVLTRRSHDMRQHEFD